MATVRCKRFGCNKMFDPAKPDETVCVHHKAPPIFHETAKYWSCCQDRKAYDWDEFMKIPGCARGEHSTEDPKKKFLGGCDVREANAPQKISTELPTDPRKKLDLLRKGLSEVGLEEGLFDRAWGKLSVKHGDLNLVVADLRDQLTAELENWGEDIEMPD
eukprot:TRINITY_DN33947_c0_g1_i1.p2 TRINITY_DN33947_c0_g1~~TRINITY_DN33947_c0_g1_i1.p2  ORF type:complete len:160 (+),score=45.42 TRINITY_DN33947_c0_g1_i1:211-690(+)